MVKNMITKIRERYYLAMALVHIVASAVVYVQSVNFAQMAGYLLLTTVNGCLAILFVIAELMRAYVHWLDRRYWGGKCQ